MNATTKYILSLIIIGVFFGALYTMRGDLKLDINLVEPEKEQVQLSEADIVLDEKSSDIDIEVNNNEDNKESNSNMTEENNKNNNQNRIIATIRTNQGDIILELFNEDAPKTVENFVKLAREDFYNKTKFHRVIKDFMIQGGDPLSKDDNKEDDRTGGPGYMFEDEINDHKLVLGTLAMANSGPNTNGSQFFIVTAESTPWLDGKHTAFGRVLSGMEVVTYIESAPTNLRDYPIEDMIVNEIIIDGDI